MAMPRWKALVVGDSDGPPVVANGLTRPFGLDDGNSANNSKLCLAGLSSADLPIWALGPQLVFVDGGDPLAAC